MGPALVYTHACILLVLPVLFPDMSSDDDAGAEGSGVPPPHKKQKTEKPRHRGKHCTVKARMGKHPGEFFDNTGLKNNNRNPKCVDDG